MNEVNYKLLLTGIIAICYLIGSIPMGYLIGRLFFKKDIRSGGSGNIGATNALRSFGTVTGIVVLLLDGLKGYACIALARLILPDGNHYAAFAGVAVVVGHIFTVFLKFKGGKGVATSAGVFLAIAPVPLLITLLTFVVVTWLTKYVSVGSILAAVAFHILTLSKEVIYNTNDIPMVVATTVVVLLIIYKHQDNLARLLNGTENRFSFKKNKGK